MKKLTLRAYAKLNLYLEVLNKRKDGYHNIKTVFERIGLYDSVTIKKRRDNRINLTCGHPDVPSGASNLAFRSASLLQESFSPASGADIKIIKRIPVGAGLGGGSSNAAAVLLGLNRLWKLNLSRKKLTELAQKIGSDVPFFIYDAPFAIGAGRGDKIRPLKELNKLRLWHLLAVPRINVSTPIIYAKWDVFSGLTMPGHNVKMLLSALRENDLPLINRVLFNSLEMVSAKLYPQVNQAKAGLIHSGLKSIKMTGSGPAVFGIVSSRKEALALSSRVKKLRIPWQVFTVKTI